MSDAINGVIIKDGATWLLLADGACAPYSRARSARRGLSPLPVMTLLNFEERRNTK